MENQKTSLIGEHIALGGNIVPFAGWDMPIQYSSIKDEVCTVRQHAGIFDVSHMGEFMVEGPEAKKFVDLLLCNDIENSPQGKAVYSPLLNDDGKCIDDLISYCLNDQKILLCVNASNCEKDWNWIQKIFKKFPYNLKLQNLSSQLSLIALQGPNSEEILQKIVGSKCALSSVPYYGVTSFQSEGEEIILARTGYTGEDGFEIFLPNSKAVSWWKKLLAGGAKPCGLGARDCLRVEVAYPLYGHELNDDLTPLDAGLKWTVKMKKNTFVGKEALEKYQPQWKQIKFFTTKAIPREGYLLKSISGENLGKVTSGTLSPTLNRGIGLGLVRADVNLNDGVLIEIRGQLSPIEITAKPFLLGGHK